MCVLYTSRPRRVLAKHIRNPSVTFQTSSRWISVKSSVDTEATLNVDSIYGQKTLNINTNHFEGKSDADKKVYLLVPHNV